MQATMRQAAMSLAAPALVGRAPRARGATAWPALRLLPPAMLLPAAMAVLLTVLILSPSIHVPEIVPGADKLAHVLAFAALVIPAGCATPRMLRWQVPLLLAFGSGLELAQSLSGRTPSWSDVAANALGLALGVAVGLLLSHMAWRRRDDRLEA
ncbi:hypothetical protein [Rhodovulum marinum]|uniref:VanZ like protein n=1 Tax=Rhodovulum marinum TaxID=320662 RepID=A0A4R2PUH3_9RHOB|nr:hypothetical protein [Rhodovulum marinum]TCP39610.1 hypothetical protein EV662_11190 [Rhodovulum marinum]